VTCDHSRVLHALKDTSVRKGSIELYLDLSRNRALVGVCYQKPLGFYRVTDKAFVLALTSSLSYYDIRDVIGIGRGTE
jgi:hypothetical protein